MQCATTCRRTIYREQVEGAREREREGGRRGKIGREKESEKEKKRGVKYGGDIS